VKKTALLNPALSRVIAELGHMDALVVADAGLPIPAETQRIDLALTQGVPGFVETLRVIVQEMQVERAIAAEETEKVSPHILEAIHQALPGVPVELVPHTDLKEMTHHAHAVVRTGEFTPYANVVLISGVVF
jgi:D-ribose pyranase